MKQIIEGRNLMLFTEDGQSIGWATNHTLTISVDTIDISTKDHGIYGASEAGKVNWEVSSENLYSTEDYDKLFDLLIARQPIKIYFGIKAEDDNEKTVADGDYEYWTPKSGSVYSGKAIITSLVTNAQNGEKANFSLTMVGNGKLVKELAEQAGGDPSDGKQEP